MTSTGKLWVNLGAKKLLMETMFTFSPWHHCMTHSHTHTTAAAAHTQEGVDITETFHTQTLKNTVLMKTHSHTHAEDRWPQRIKAPESASIIVVLEESGVPLQELQQDRGIRPEYYTLYSTQVLHWPEETQTMLHIHPGLSRVLLICDLLILLLAYPEQKNKHYYIYRAWGRMLI